jgi:hypothetical protein
MKTKDKIRKLMKERGWTDAKMGVLAQEFIVEKRQDRSFLNWLEKEAKPQDKLKLDNEVASKL